MKKHLAILFLGTVCSVFAQKHLYTVELTTDNLADIDPRQNVMLKTADHGKKAVLVAKGDSSWLDLKRELCLGKEIIVTFRCKAADNEKGQKNLRAVLRYAKGDVYCDGPEGKPVTLPVRDVWENGSCSMKFPAQLEEAMIMFSSRTANVLVTDIKVYRKDQGEK